MSTLDKLMVITLLFLIVCAQVMIWELNDLRMNKIESNIEELHEKN